MSLTKVSNSMITGAPISVFDYMTAAEITAVQTGVYGSVTPTQITAAIQVSLDAIPRNSGNIYNANWVLPEGFWNINNEIFFPKASEPTAEIVRSVLTFNGTITQTDDTKNGITFGLINASKIIGLKMYGALTDQTALGKSCVTFNNSILDSEIEIVYIYSGSTYGVRWTPTGGSSSWNKIYLGMIRNMKYGFHVTCDGSVGNYFNANQIYGGNFYSAYTTISTNNYGIYITGNNYQNTWYSPAFAGLNVDIRWQNAIGWNMVSPYFDTPLAYEVAADLTACSQGTWTHGYSTFTDLTFIVSTDSRANTFINTGEYSPGGPNMSIDQNGVIFTFPELKNVMDGNSLLYGPTVCTLLSRDHQGTYQWMNKQAEGTSAIPSSGSYRKGAIVWNTSTVAAGQAMGHMCSGDGTMGTLSGVTGSITIGTSTLVVNDASDLRYAQYIAVAGAFTGQLITGISGTTITMSGVAGATVIGAAVSFYSATWVALPNFA